MTEPTQQPIPNTQRLSAIGQPRFVDFHAHTTASDGTATPTELVHAARAAGLYAVAVTDHDTTAGVAEAQAAARALRDAGDALAPLVLPGVELSADGPPGKCHLLGLGVDPHHAGLNRTLAELSENRRARNEKMAARLRALGVPVTLAEVTAVAPPGANVGRPHFAQTLVQKGVVADLREAFDKYLGDNAAGYVEKTTLSPEDAIKLIHEAGGLCFLAHPGLINFVRVSHTEASFVKVLQGYGLDGVEAYYSSYTPATTAKFVQLAQNLKAEVTGGSDFHGAAKPHIHLSGIRDEGASLLPLLDVSPHLAARLAAL